MFKNVSGGLTMNKILISKNRVRQLSLVLLALSLAGPVLAQEAEKKEEEKKNSTEDKSSASGAPARREESVRASINAKVTDIDHEKRQITLKGPEGKETTLAVDKSVERFNEINVGDQVTANYYASLAGEVREATEAEKRSPLTDVTIEGKAGRDTDPLAGAVRTVKAVAKVEKLDPVKKQMTIKGPRGKSYDVAVEKPSTFEKVKAGDTIVITFTEALAVSVEKHPANE
jgi:hypothetical protein